MCMVVYTWPVVITYDRGGEFPVHQFKSSLIEQEYGIKTKRSSSGNPKTNVTIEKLIKY